MFKAPTTYTVQVKGYYHFIVYCVMLNELFLAPASSFSASLMASYMIHMLGKFVIAYIDNILICSPDKTIHVQQIKKDLSWVFQNQLHIKEEKRES